MQDLQLETLACPFPWILVTHTKKYKLYEHDDQNQVIDQHPDEDADQNQAAEHPDEEASQNHDSDGYPDEETSQSQGSDGYPDEDASQNDEHPDGENNQNHSNEQPDEDEDERQPFLIGNQGNPVQVLPELGSKEIKDYCDGWLLLLDEYDGGYSIFNPLTLQSERFPALILKPQQEITFYILSSPPGNPDSMLILFEKSATCFIFCRIGDNQWTEQPARGNLDYKDNDGDYITEAVRCNGKLYCQTHHSKKIVEIELMMPDQFVMKLLPVKIPRFLEIFRMSFYFKMMGSSDQLFVIYMGLRRIPSRVYFEPNGVEVYRLNFSRLEWEMVDSAKDIAFFISSGSQFCCPAVGSQIEGSNVYFFIESLSFYSFNLEEKRLHVSLPYSNLPPSRFLLTCLMPDFKRDDLDGGTKEIKLETRQVLKHEAIKRDEISEIEGNFSKLSLHILSVISRRLILHDYTSFRAVNRICRLAAPPIQWMRTAWNEFEFYDLLPPWLMFCQNGVCNFIDPLHGKRYPMSIPDVSSKVFRILYSRDGWCVILHGENSIFFWNSFSKKIIQLPDMLHKCEVVVSCCFSCSPSSSDCVLVLVCTEDECEFDIDIISLEDREWVTFFAFTSDELVVTDNNTPVFFQGSFYFPGLHGNLGVFQDLEFFEVLDNLHCPCDSFHESYLLECDGKLLSVFVGSFGEWVRVFGLDFSETAWIELEDLGDKTLYLSRFSSFSMTATIPAMEKKIYFPRFSGKNIIYYSLESKKFQSHGTKDVFRGFYHTSEQLLSGWVELKW